MATIQVSNTNKKKSTKLEASRQGKMIKRFYTQFVESLSRKTDSEKRIQLYGKDPFK